MKVIFDIEANGLDDASEIWLIVCKELASGKLHIFRNVTHDPEQRVAFIEYAGKVDEWIGHNILGYDWPTIRRLLGLSFDPSHCTDTLIISKLIDYSRKGHSIAAYGEEFGLEKIDFSDWSKWSQAMEDYCIRDVDICEKIYKKYIRYINNPERQPSIRMEHEFQLLVNDLHDNGFAFNVNKAQKLLAKVTDELVKLDTAISESFPPREVLIREFTPKATKFGTISKTSVPRSLHGEIENYEVGKTYRHTKQEPFNPASHKQLIDILHEAGWQPVEKTKTRIDKERELGKLRYQRNRPNTVDFEISKLHNDLQKLEKYGWKITEANLATLPPSAPAPARTLAKRILLESRRRTLTEWLTLVRPNGRIHGQFYGIGAWTHRMAHQNPNTANIPREFTEDGSVKLLGKEMRELWIAPKDRLLVGCDAEGIQLRIFAHYIDDKEFTEALVHGKKADGSDPHSLNRRIIGDVCKTRQAAKRFIYALLLGAGLPKLSAILGCDDEATRASLDRLMERYTGFSRLKEDVIPADAKRGWFVGLDGRAVKIPGEELGLRRHLCMSGYLQNGEAVVKKRQAILWNKHPEIVEFRKTNPILFVDMVHDEDQTETPNDFAISRRVAEIQADCYKVVGEELGLKCPLAGSYWNDDIDDYTIGTNWYKTH